MTKYKNIFSKGYTENWQEKYLLSILLSVDFEVQLIVGLIKLKI